MIQGQVSGLNQEYNSYDRQLAEVATALDRMGY